MWDLWDCGKPIRIHGFVTGSLSAEMLSSRLNDNGTFHISDTHFQLITCFIGVFLFRFSSQGGVSVDYVVERQVKKALWKCSAIPDTYVPRL